MLNTLAYYLFTVLFVGGPALILFILAVNCFLNRMHIRGVLSLLISILFLGLLIFKIFNPDWSLLTR
jgi:hypothetical protein